MRLLHFVSLRDMKRNDNKGGSKSVFDLSVPQELL